MGWVTVSMTIRLPAAMIARVRALAATMRCKQSSAARLALARGLKGYEEESGTERIGYRFFLDKQKGDSGSFVYFIQAGESPTIKIGFCKGDPSRRLRQLQTSSPARLRLLLAVSGGQRKEQALHRQFAGLRINGEWFRADQALLDFIETEKKRQAKRIQQRTDGKMKKIRGGCLTSVAGNHQSPVEEIIKQT